MSNKNLSVVINWGYVRANVITEHGHTLWQLTEKYLNSTERAIDSNYPPLSLIEWILKY